MNNPSIKITSKELLSDNWYKLFKVTYEYLNKKGKWETHIRESYDRGNGAVILLYNPKNRNVILTKQFRLPSYMNGNDDGMMIEACAGLLDKDNPEDCIIREAEEETGYLINKVQKVFECYMSPGAVTEILHFFIAEYDDHMKVSEGGGLQEEQENIEVLELSIDRALDMVYSGEIKDAKTIMLLQHAQIHKLIP